MIPKFRAWVKPGVLSNHNYDDGEFSYIGSVKKDCYQFYINGIEPVDSYDFIDVSNTFDGTTSLTIIGNIYENLELLEAIE